MKKLGTVMTLLIAGICLCTAAAGRTPGNAIDIRGVWVGSAQGPIFGAEGSVKIISQNRGRIYGIVEGGNFFGNARFDIRGTISGNMITGNKAGNVFQGHVYQDGTIRGRLRTVEGEVYRIFLRRPYSPWGRDPYGRW